MITLPYPSTGFFFSCFDSFTYTLSNSVFSSSRFYRWTSPRVISTRRSTTAELGSSSSTPPYVSLSNDVSTFQYFLCIMCRLFYSNSPTNHLSTLPLLPPLPAHSGVDTASVSPPPGRSSPTSIREPPTSPRLTAPSRGTFFFLYIYIFFLFLLLHLLLLLVLVLYSRPLYSHHHPTFATHLQSHLQALWSPWIPYCEAFQGRSQRRQREVLWCPYP